mmetsp:Transcript_16867/g.39976  ORF Transcript_16867/g.39976 Transcript_16867/m.39976 type:complete len:305 (+) Transcript_16867:1062-1976(+)
MSGEPSLDAPVLPDELDELAALGVVGVVEPAAAVDDVVLLQDAESGAVGRGVGEDEYLPPLVGRVVLEGLLEPLALLLVDGDLVGGVLGVAEDGGGKADEEGLVGDLADEVGAGLFVGAEEQLEVLGVRGELVDALEVVVAADDLVGDAEGPEEVGGRLVADGGAGEQLAGVGGVVVAVLGLAEVAQGAEGDVAVGLAGLAEDGQPLGPAGLVVLHLARVDVQVSQDGDAELVGGHAQGRATGGTGSTGSTDTGRTSGRGGDPGQGGGRVAQDDGRSDGDLHSPLCLCALIFTRSHSLQRIRYM